MRATYLAALILVSFCACSSETDTADESGTGTGGRPNVDNNDDDNTNGRGDTDEESDATATPDDSASRDTGGGTRDIGGGSDTNPGGGGACSADTLDEAIDCQVVANDGFVDAYCDCFTEQGYDGDRAACEADQPNASAFEPDACARAALLRDEDASIVNSACYAAAVNELAGCFAVCPPNEETFNACFEDVTAAFDVCDAALPASVTDALLACGGGPVDPPADVSAATAALESQRDAWVGSYCTCYGASEFGSVATCATTQASVYNPGLSACEQTAVSAQGDAGLAFLVCVGESFTIAESGCAECPSRGSIEYDLCSDPGVDINFCFGQATTALQDALIACSR